DRLARGARDAARPDRGAARRALVRRAPPATGRGGAREDVLAFRAGRARGAERGGAAAAPRRARAEGGAGPPGRSALARARPVRLPPRPRQARRLRDALEARAPREASRRRRPPLVDV